MNFAVFEVYLGMKCFLIILTAGTMIFIGNLVKTYTFLLTNGVSAYLYYIEDTVPPEKLATYEMGMMKKLRTYC